MNFRPIIPDANGSSQISINSSVNNENPTDGNKFAIDEFVEHFIIFKFQQRFKEFYRLRSDKYVASKLFAYCCLSFILSRFVYLFWPDLPEPFAAVPVALLGFAAISLWILYLLSITCLPPERCEEAVWVICTLTVGISSMIAVGLSANYHNHDELTHHAKLYQDLAVFIFLLPMILHACQPTVRWHMTLGMWIISSFSGWFVLIYSIRLGEPLYVIAAFLLGSYGLFSRHYERVNLCITMVRTNSVLSNTSTSNATGSITTNGKTPGVDVQELLASKNQVEELKAQTRQLRILLSNTAHDLKTVSLPFIYLEYREPFCLTGIICTISAAGLGHLHHGVPHRSSGLHV